jgi:hypothetical protein
MDGCNAKMLGRSTVRAGMLPGQWLRVKIDRVGRNEEHAQWSRTRRHLHNVDELWGGSGIVPRTTCICMRVRTVSLFDWRVGART